MADREVVFEIVRQELLRLTRGQGVRLDEISADASLVGDLGLDSIRFLDLTVALERALGVDELPLQDWQDAEAYRADKRYTVGSLVDWCAPLAGADAVKRSE